jgi:hypothetical protein
MLLRFGDGISVPLDGAWQYRKVPKEYGDPPRAPWETAGGISTLSNGMIAPLGHYGLRGMLWYQGESNTGDADGYRRFLRLLRSDWRVRFGKDLPMLFVQLANFGAAPTQPAESNWARLRDVQREVAAADPHSGLAVTIDIGDRYDIHPANKQELGRRVARLARHVVYGERELAPSGPVPQATKRDADAIVVSFGDVTKGLVAYGADGPVGFALCGAMLSMHELEQARRIADVVRLGHVTRIERDRLVLEHGELPAGGALHIDATASGLRLVDAQPIFTSGRMTLQQVRHKTPPFNAALLAWVEANREDDEEKNRLCPPNPFTRSVEEWARMVARTWRTEGGWRTEPDLQAWTYSTRLNMMQALPHHLDEPRAQAALSRYAGNVGDAVLRLEELAAAG